MSSSLALATALLATALPPDVLACRLQPGGAWARGPREVSAVICEDVPGFFVPSLEYRSLIDPRGSEPYRLLEEELSLATNEIDALRKAGVISADEIAKLRLANQRGSEALALEARRGDELEQDLEARWAGSTWFLLGVGAGVLLIAGVVVAVVVAENRIGP